MADSSQPEMPRKATKKKKNHYTKQKQEEAEDERSNITEEDAPSRPEMKPQDMSITEKKRLTCFFYYGGERRVLPSGTFHYVGGVSEAMMIEDDMTKGELLSRIGSRLKISLHNKLIFHNTKRDKIKYLRVKDDNGVKMMFYLNEDEVDVFVDEDPFDTSSRESNIVESNKTPREKKHLTCICYWNGIRTVLPDGTFNYSRGASEAVLIEDGMSYNELLSKICSCLEIPTYDKVVFYNFKRDKTKYLRVKDDNGVEMLFHMNEEEVDVFVEEEPSSRDSGWDYYPAILGEANGCMHRGVGEANGCMHRGVDEANGCMHRGVGEANGCMHRGVGEANGCRHRGVDEGSAQLFCMILLLLVLVFVLFQL